MRLLQITDLHLTGENKNKDHAENNNNYIHLVKFLKTNLENLRADHLIVTGDISHDGSEESYQLFFKEMNSLCINYSLLPENHDNAESLNSFKGVLDNSVEIDKIHDNQWAALAVNSVVEGEDYGFIEKKTLEALESQLIALKNVSVALFLHHHLLPVGTPLVDDCKLNNSQELLTVCARNNVKLIGTGHAHTLFQQKVGNILISVSPAVCSQWENGATSVKYIKNTGFSILSLEDKANVETYLI